MIRTFCIMWVCVAAGACNTEVKKDAAKVYNPRTAQPGATIDVNDLGTLSFADTLHNFGNITEGEVVECAFTYTNTGRRPLLIATARPSCGCTASDYKSTDIAVGEKGDIKVKFNSDGKKGHQEKTILVTTNGNPSEITLKIAADVK